jgi:O-antigen/teichoic acid export membrane protein
VVLILFKNFIFYLIIQTVFQLLGNLVLSLKVNKYYPFLKKYKAVKLDSESKKQIYSNVKANSFIKIGGILVNSTDNLILNYFSGIAMVGLLSNYNLLIGLGSSLIVQVFSSLTASVANINAIESQDKKIETFNLINFMNFWIYGFFSVAILFLINDFILIWIGQNYVLPLSVVVLLVINFYMYGMQNAVWMFKFTLGIFKQGQYIILFTALINLVLSFIFGYYYGLVGILAATAIARMVTNAWFDPYIVFKLGLNLNPLHYLIKYIKYLLILVLSIAVILVIMNYVTVNGLLLVVIKVIVVMITPNIFIILFYRNNADFKNLMSMLNVLIKKFTKKTA